MDVLNSLLGFLLNFFLPISDSFNLLKLTSALTKLNKLNEIPPMPPTAQNEIGELIDCFFELIWFLVPFFNFFLFMALTTGGIAGLIIISLVIILCIGILVLYWASKKAAEGPQKKE